MQSASVRTVLALALFLLAPAVEAADSCPQCTTWNAPQKPFKLFGNSYYVGPHGLGAILITSDQGHILIDGALPESAPEIASRITGLGFKLQDIKVILNSHAHFDHAGGIAALQKMTGAVVYASSPSAKVLETGAAAEDDPQHGTLAALSPIASVKVLHDGEVVRVGPLALTARFTPGHTSGGTSWTWEACESRRCLQLVYADSLFAAGASDYRFSRHPDVAQSFERSFATVGALPCDILVSAHPEFSGLWNRLERREKGDADGLIDRAACRRYADMMQKRLKDAFAEEASGR